MNDLIASQEYRDGVMDALEHEILSFKHYPSSYYLRGVNNPSQSFYRTNKTLPDSRASHSEYSISKSNEDIPSNDSDEITLHNFMADVDQISNDEIVKLLSTENNVRDNYEDELMRVQIEYDDLLQQFLSRMPNYIPDLLDREDSDGDDGAYDDEDEELQEREIPTRSYSRTLSSNDFDDNNDYSSLNDDDTRRPRIMRTMSQNDDADRVIGSPNTPSSRYKHRHRGNQSADRRSLQSGETGGLMHRSNSNIFQRQASEQSLVSSLCGDIDISRHPVINQAVDVIKKSITRSYVRDNAF